ncbi:uncharacterized protein LOC117234513 [Bombus vosnesenskii]|uniref:Uncharacterized protein LOC117234513 n=1 Tax=Bombus vosnesenskii TaxID=207650 RepID=A0A6J3KF38_9HYME|nr:uncharacterized protein LOC117234513 [Bombus vosnesenskii]
MKPSDVSIECETFDFVIRRSFLLFSFALRHRVNPVAWNRETLPSTINVVRQGNLRLHGTSSIGSLGKDLRWDCRRQDRLLFGLSLELVINKLFVFVNWLNFGIEILLV